MEVLNVGRTAVWRTRAAYLEGGLDFALASRHADNALSWYM
jgi:hypothetical protein